MSQAPDPGGSRAIFALEQMAHPPPAPVHCASLAHFATPFILLPISGAIAC
jgi:hypothetical protein